MQTLHLKSGKDHPVRLGHPWIFLGAIRDLDRNLEPGSVVRIAAAAGDVLGVGYVNPQCTIAVRMLARADESIDGGFIRRRIAAAIAARAEAVGADTTAYRLVNGEGDGLPGFVVDRYGDVLVLQSLTAGAERLKPWIVEALLAELRPQAIVERSDGSVRRAEGLPPSSGVLHGAVPDDVVVQENGLAVAVAPGRGQKTGYFCDQRPNRALLRTLAAGRRVLDAFTYTGGFAIHAGAGGAASVVAVDDSARALQVAERNWALNGLDPATVTFIDRDVGSFLRDGDDRFDLVVLDPPALVKRRTDLQRGTRAYKDLQLWALRRAAPDAFVVAFTCSQHVDAALFRRIAAAAAADARRDVQLLQHLGPGPDHPVAVGHPEGEYLHGLLLRVR